MKSILIALVVLLTVGTDSDDLIGTYQIIDELSADTLELRKNGTFTYKDRGDSCWTWADLNGKWKVQKGILILTEEIKYIESSVQAQTIEVDKPNDSIVVFARSIENIPLPNMVVKYISYDDYKIFQVDSVSKNGIFKFRKYDMGNTQTYAAHVSYTIKDKEIIGNLSVKPNTDSVNIVINKNPKFINETRTHSFNIFEQQLVLKKSNSLIEGTRYKKL